MQREGDSDGCVSHTVIPGSPEAQDDSGKSPDCRARWCLSHRLGKSTYVQLKVLREASPGLESGRPPLSMRDPFQDPYWLPETTDFQYICIYDKVEFIN